MSLLFSQLAANGKLSRSKVLGNFRKEKEQKSSPCYVVIICEENDWNDDI